MSVIIRENTSETEPRTMVDNDLNSMTKLVVDVERAVISLGCDLHIDCYEQLIEDGSSPKDLWGANIYPNKKIDYVSLINIKPDAGNRSMEIQDGELRQKIEAIIKKLIF